MTPAETVLKRFPPQWFPIYLKELVNLRYLNLGSDQCPYVVRLFNYDVESLSFEMERLSIDLLGWIRTGPSASERGKILSQLLKAIHWLHSCGIVHADLKLNNLMILRSDLKLLKIIDFGFSGPPKWAHHNYTNPIYSDPQKSDSFEGDIYSLGVILIELITGSVVSGLPKDQLKSLDRHYIDCIRSMMSKTRPRPTAGKICSDFGISIDSTSISTPVPVNLEGIPKLRPKKVDLALEKWIEQVIKINQIEGPFCLEEISTITQSLIPEGKIRYTQFYAAAVLSIYGSYYHGKIGLSTMISLCPTRYCRLKRKTLLCSIIGELMANDLFICSLTQCNPRLLFDR